MTPGTSTSLLTHPLGTAPLPSEQEGALARCNTPPLGSHTLKTSSRLKDLHGFSPINIFLTFVYV